MCVCVCINEIAHNHAIRSCHPSHSMPLALVFQRGIKGSMILVTKTSCVGGGLIARIRNDRWKIHRIAPKKPTIHQVYLYRQNEARMLALIPIYSLGSSSSMLFAEQILVLRSNHWASTRAHPLSHTHILDSAFVKK